MKRRISSWLKTSNEEPLDPSNTLPLACTASFIIGGVLGAIISILLVICATKIYHLVINKKNSTLDANFSEVKGRKHSGEYLPIIN